MREVDLVNIVQFPKVFSANDGQSVGRQLDLFGDIEGPKSLVSFIDIDIINQDDLFCILTRNSVSALVDIRPRPIFRSPKFDHHEVSCYLSVHNIMYFDYAVAVRDPELGRPNAIARRVNRGREIGLTICLYDLQTREKGWVERARMALKRSKLFRAELSSRSLVGMPQ